MGRKAATPETCEFSEAGIHDPRLSAEMRLQRCLENVHTGLLQTRVLLRELDDTGRQDVRHLIPALTNVGELRFWLTELMEEKEQ